MTFNKEQLLAIAKGYLNFLLTRESQFIKSFLSLDFVERQKATEQLKLIQKLPKLNYGLNPEAHLWEEYVVTDEENGNKIIEPFQFDIYYKNLMNPLETELMTVTLNSVIFEDRQWRIGSLISDDEERVLKNYIKQISDTSPEISDDSLYVLDEY